MPTLAKPIQGSSMDEHGDLDPARRRHDPPHSNRTAPYPRDPPSAHRESKPPTAEPIQPVTRSNRRYLLSTGTGTGTVAAPRWYRRRRSTIARLGKAGQPATIAAPIHASFPDTFCAACYTPSVRTPRPRKPRRQDPRVRPPLGRCP